MIGSKHLDWIPETEVKTSMSPEAEAHAPSVKHTQSAEDNQFSARNNKWKGVSVSGINTSQAPEAVAMVSSKLPDNVLKEGLDNMNTSVGSGFVLASDSKINSSIVPGYIPTLGETQTKDISDLIERENTTFILSAIAGVSVVVLGWMILSAPSA